MSKEKLMELTEKQQENRREDKKAFKKFALILVLAFFAGIGIGVGSVILGHMLDNASTKETMITVLQYVAVYGGFLFTTVLLVTCVILNKKCRREYTVWDEEDEDVLTGIETKLSYVLWFSNLIMYGAYFFFSVGIWATDIIDMKSVPGQSFAGFGISLGAVFLHMVYVLVAACITQQKAVNLSKEINPEKKGSVYDTKFQDKWLANCDEAERFAVYKCSFKTFKIMQITGMVLWLVCLLGQMMFNTGVFATIIVTIFMIIQTSVYSVQGIYFAKHPSEVMK